MPRRSGCSARTRAPRRLWRSAGRRGGRRRHRQGARGVRSRRWPNSQASRRRASISRSPPSRTARRPTPSAPMRLARRCAARRAVAQRGQARLASLKGEPAPPRSRRGRVQRRHSGRAEGDDRGHGEPARRTASPAMAAASTNGRALFAPTRSCMRADKAKAALADARKALAPDSERGRESRRARARPRPRRRQLTRRSRRLALVAAALAVIGWAAGLALYALRDSIVFFYSPTEVAEKAPQPGARLRVGGLVKTGSVVKSAGETIAFVRHRRRPRSQGCLPRPPAGPVPRGSGRGRRGRAGAPGRLRGRHHSRQA